MSLRATFWMLAVLFFFVLPLPLLGPFGATIPAARFVLLAGAAGLIAALEGAAGPVPAIVALLIGHAVAYTLVCAGLAWAAMRMLAPFSADARRVAVFSALALALAIALGFDLYTTPFGTQPTASLWNVLS